MTIIYKIADHEVPKKVWEQYSKKEKRIAELENALDRIARPIWWIEEDQKAKTGSINGLNGKMCQALSEDPNYLKSIAKKALSDD
jgi:hypothetical protein